MRPLPGLIGSTFASLTLVVLTLGFASTAKADELILNGGFESGFAGWTGLAAPGAFLQPRATSRPSAATRRWVPPVETFMRYQTVKGLEPTHFCKRS